MIFALVIVIGAVGLAAIGVAYSFVISADRRFGRLVEDQELERTRLLAAVLEAHEAGNDAVERVILTAAGERSLLMNAALSGADPLTYGRLQQFDTQAAADASEADLRRAQVLADAQAPADEYVNDETGQPMMPVGLGED